MSKNTIVKCMPIKTRYLRDYKIRFQINFKFTTNFIVNGLDNANFINVKKMTFLATTN